LYVLLKQPNHSETRRIHFEILLRYYCKIQILDSRFLLFPLVPQPLQGQQKEEEDRSDSEDEGDRQARVGEDGSSEKDREPEEELEKGGAEKEGEGGEGELEGKKEESALEEGEAKVVKAPLRPRTMQIRVTLLDNTLFECELDVS